MVSMIGTKEWMTTPGGQNRNSYHGLNQFLEELDTDPSTDPFSSSITMSSTCIRQV
jgi:hypothetical protein